MSNINLNLYRTFCAVAKSKSYAEASEKLHISIPAISTNITKLEELLNTQLFYREKDGVRLTETGKELFELVDKGLATFDLGEKLIMQKNDLANGEITIGCPSHLTSFYLLNSIEKAKIDYPNLKVKIISGANSYELLQLLQNHKVDFVIIDVLPNDINNNFEVKELKTINNIFISKEPLIINNLKELENFKYILNFDYTITTKNLMECLKENNIKIKAYIESDTTEVRLEAVKRNLGIGYVMKESAKNDLDNKNVYEVKLPIELPSLKINLLYMKEQLTKVDKSFIKKYLENEI